MQIDRQSLGKCVCLCVSAHAFSARIALAVVHTNKYETFVSHACMHKLRAYNVFANIILRSLCAVCVCLCVWIAAADAAAAQ